MPINRRSGERGVALITVMLLTVAMAALVASAIFLTSSASLVSRGHEREEDMRNAADGGIELGRSALNGNPALFPDTGYVALVLGQQVLDASGVPMPGVTRSIYYGPTGSSTGQYGIFGSVVSIIQDPSGALAVRRGELAQESFARYAYFTNSEGTGICFGGGDQIFGPMHTNANMCIYSSGVHFHDVVEVSGTVTGAAYGTFDMGYLQHGAVVPLPTMADLVKLNTYATIGGMSFAEIAGGTTYQPRMRIEFMAIDLDGDGRVTGPDEGFFRIYEDTGATDLPYIVADRAATTALSLNCGDVHTNAAGSPGYGAAVFYTAGYHYNNGPPPGTPTTHTATMPGTTAQKTARGNESLTYASHRCYLGGDEHLYTTSLAGGPTPRNTFVPADSLGKWRLYSATPDAAVIAGLKNAASNTIDTTLANRTLLAQYLWPMSRAFNPNTKGVIYVAGRVALSGVLDSRVTVAASSDVIIADDLRYAIAPGSAPCPGSNMLGILSGGSVIVADNTLNAPWSVSSTYRNYDDSDDELLQAVILTLNSFTVENYGTGAGTGQPCQTANWGRGCLALTGGIIQGTRGAVGTTAGTGYIKRYAYDACAFQTPPPYFPTTGRFIRNRYYEIDPVGFDVSAFFHSLTPTQ